MSADFHFVTGKGGVGKSTLAAALTSHLSAKKEGPVLLIDVQGSGRALRLLGLDRQPFNNTALPETDNAWGARILPRETFKQYFGLLLALGNEHSAFAQVTAGLRDRVTDILFENKVVTAFVDVCPGLEPAVLLGKLHWEATEGETPETDIPWRHVVIDAPATGHGVMLFRSTFALMDVFGGGAIFRQAAKVKEYMQDPTKTHLYMVTTPEELPMQESLEMKQKLEALKLRPQRYFINRCPPSFEANNTATVNSPEWSNEAKVQQEIWNDQAELIKKFKTDVGPGASILELPEVADATEGPALATLAAMLKEGGL